MKKALSILLIILTLALILTGCQSASKKYELGVEAMKNKDWDEAITYFSDLTITTAPTF